MKVIESEEIDKEEAFKATIDPYIKQRLWMIRDCSWYDEEYSDCTSIRSRFHQYFVFGETSDCNQWRRDSANCYRWRDSNDLESAKELLKSETARREERLAPHINNDIWEHRTEPPKNWNDPLPEWMQKENENSFLAIKAKEEKTGSSGPLDNRQSLCVIM